MSKYQNIQIQSDLAELIQQDIDWSLLKEKTVLITGATGMLGSYIGFTLLYLNERLGLKIRPIFLARKKDKLEHVYGDALKSVTCLVQDVCSPIELNHSVDYILHAAGSSSPYSIINDPVGVINANVKGTQNILELSRRIGVKKIVFTSTREVYGQLRDENYISEEQMGSLDPLNPRNCYPESKRLAEALLQAYQCQYRIGFNSLRIAHCYGPGMQLDSDGRVMADLLNDVINKRDITLKSLGEAERAFCYITDAVSGIFRVMLSGNRNEAYNLSNEKEPISIGDLANLIQEVSGNSKGVLFDVSQDQRGYTDYRRVSLDTKRIEDLGWSANVPLKIGIKRTLNSISSCAKS